MSEQFQRTHSVLLSAALSCEHGPFVLVTLLFSETLGPFIRGKIRRVLAKPRLILDEMLRLYGKFASYLRRVLCKTRLIFPRINGPIVRLRDPKLNPVNRRNREHRRKRIPQE